MTLLHFSEVEFWVHECLKLIHLTLHSHTALPDYLDDFISGENSTVISFVIIN